MAMVRILTAPRARQVILTLILLGLWGSAPTIQQFVQNEKHDIIWNRLFLNELHIYKG